MESKHPPRVRVWNTNKPGDLYVCAMSGDWSGLDPHVPKDYISLSESNALAEEREARARREAFKAAIELVWKHLAVMQGSTQARDDLVMDLKAQAPEKEQNDERR